MLSFTDEMIKSGNTSLYLEEDNITFTCEKIEPLPDNKYILYGTASIDGEEYKDFHIEVKLDTSLDNPKEILEAQWEYYDFIF